MPESIILVYGADWCGDCLRAKRFLIKHDIPFRWIDIEQDREAENFVIKTNLGKRSIPTIVFQDGSRLVEPSNSALANKLGLKE